MKVVTTEHSIFTVRPDDHIIECCANPTWNQPETPEIAKHFALTIKELVGNDIYGTLMYASEIYVDKEILDAYSSVDIGHVANAMIVTSVFSKVFANLALKFVKTETPKKIFTQKLKPRIQM